MSGIRSNLRPLREAKGLTQADLAQALAVSRQTIISIEQGRFAPSLVLALRMARHFGLPVEALFALADPTQAPLNLGDAAPNLPPKTEV